MSLNNRHARKADVSMRASEVTVLVILDVSVIFIIVVVVVVVVVVVMWKNKKIEKNSCQTTKCQTLIFGIVRDEIPNKRYLPVIL